MRAETRRQLKQDSFSRVTIEAAEKTAHWSVEHRSTLIISAIVVAVALAVGIGGWYYLNDQDQKASLELSIAVRTTETPLRPADAPEQPDFFGPTEDEIRQQNEREMRQFEADRRSWVGKVLRLQQELDSEPAKVRRGYEVQARRLEPIGLVYLWPATN